jgi:hypothetical protein
MIWPKFLATVALFLFCLSAAAQTQKTTYLGFDRNEYPGDANLKILRKTFSYTGYWLNNPPGESANTWAGHRRAVENTGFGFLVLFNGRPYADLKTVLYATRLGRADAIEALASAHREGFPTGTLIFLDQEQGGRMLPEQKAYIYGWVDGVINGGFRAGIYCSGIASKDDGNVVTAEDIRKDAGNRKITYWAINDACPPAPGCSFPPHPPAPAQSGVRFAEVWQFAQSPRRKDVAAQCGNYSDDGECYAPGSEADHPLHLDMNSATSSDPSHGRTSSR